MNSLLDKAKTQLVLRHPFYAAIVLGVPLIETDEVPTAATDGTRIFYNKAFMEQFDHKVQMFVLAHEAEHIVRLHAYRKGSRNHRKFNIAADHIINLDLQRAGFTLPPKEVIKIFCDKQYDGMYTEEVYDKLQDDQSDGEPQFGGDDVLDPVSSDPAEAASAEAKVRGIIHKAAAAGRMAGNMPEHIKTIIDDMMTPVVDWRAVLNRFMTARAVDDYTWSRPNKRVLHRGLRLPSRHSEVMGELAIVVDVSGSCWGEVPQFMAEVAAIAAMVKPEKIHILWTDAAVMRHDEHDDANDITQFDLAANACHGGGTDLSVAWDYMAENGIDPVCAVVLSDLYTPFGNEPEYHVLWVSTTDEVAPYGETVQMKL